MSTATLAPALTNREIIAEIRTLTMELNGDLKGLPGLSKLRKPELEQLLAGVRLNLEAKREREHSAPLHEQPMEGSPAAVARAEESDTVEARAAADRQAHTVAVRMGLIDEPESVDMLDAQDSLRPLFSHAGRRPTASQRAHRRARNRMQRISRRRNRR